MATFIRFLFPEQAKDFVEFEVLHPNHICLAVDLGETNPGSCRSVDLLGADLPDRCQSPCRTDDLTHSIGNRRGVILECVLPSLSEPHCHSHDLTVFRAELINRLYGCTRDRRRAPRLVRAVSRGAELIHGLPSSQSKKPTLSYHCPLDYPLSTAIIQRFIRIPL